MFPFQVLDELLDYAVEFASGDFVAAVGAKQVAVSFDGDEFSAEFLIPHGDRNGIW